MTHIEIIKKLIGEIRPVGETNEDDRRFENLKDMCELVNNLVSEIDTVEWDFAKSSEYSKRRASDFSGNFLKKTLGIK